jgi:hypothetical protein
LCRSRQRCGQQENENPSQEAELTNVICHTYLLSEWGNGCPLPLSC